MSPASRSRSGGVACGPGVRQLPGNSYAAPCVPAFRGDNGGATARGVTATSIRVVRRAFPDSANSQAVDAVVAQAGGATQATVRSVRSELQKRFDQTYELYGRKVEWVDYTSRFGNETLETQGRGREGASGLSRRGAPGHSERTAGDAGAAGAKVTCA